MKIFEPKVGAGQKPGVGATANPFKRLMSEPSGPKGGKVQGEAASQGGAGPGHQGLADGVTPLTANAHAKRPSGVLQKIPALKPQAVHAASAIREAARRDSNATAENLVELRAHAAEHARKGYDTRLVDLICQELKIEFGERSRVPANSDRAPAQTPAPYPVQQGASVTPTVVATARQEAEVKAASAMELIEKIEAFVKSQRPGIAITLDGSLGARVEIERLGPKEVAIRLVGRNGPPSPEDIGRIRDEMRARGLKVGALSVA